MSPGTFEPGDFRLTTPRFSDESMEKNQALVDIVKRVAGRRNATPAQVALAWVLRQGSDIVPIPGTKRVTYLQDNAGSVDVELMEDDLRDLDALQAHVAGERYNQSMMAMIDT